jgi:hypothetical protein
MKSWPVTIGMMVAFGAIGGVIVAIFDLGSLAAAGICFVGIALVVVLSKRPEFHGLPPPAK